jgi:hypothetical protein
MAEPLWINAYQDTDKLSSGSQDAQNGRRHKKVEVQAKVEIKRVWSSLNLNLDLSLLKLS